MLSVYCLHKIKNCFWVVIILLTNAACSLKNQTGVDGTNISKEQIELEYAKPNFVFIFADDLRNDALGYNSVFSHTPNIDRLSARGMRFKHAYSVLSVCSPSRATVLTGRYPSSHGVTTYGNTPINPGNPSFVSTLRKAGYKTAVVGKWHLGNSPEEMGFDTADIFHGNGPWYARKVSEGGNDRVIEGFIETWSVERSIRFLQLAKASGKPFFLWYNSQVPHMDHQFQWPASSSSLKYYNPQKLPLPESYPPENKKTGKPPYLMTARSFTRAMEHYDYKDEKNLRQHMQHYYASVSDLDVELGRLFSELDALGLKDNTYVIFMSDNGWLLGEHGMTSKVLAYTPSMQVPLVVTGPGVHSRDSDAMITNADMAPFILTLANLNFNGKFHGESFAKLIHQEQDPDSHRQFFYYESPTPQLVPRSFFAIRDKQYLYIETYHKGKKEFTELYDVSRDPSELKNLALNHATQKLVQQYSLLLTEQREHFRSF